MDPLEELEGKVKANTDAKASAVVLAQGIASLLNAETDIAEVKLFASDLSKRASALGAAVVANTKSA